MSSSSSLVAQILIAINNQICIHWCQEDMLLEATQVRAEAPLQSKSCCQYYSAAGCRAWEKIQHMDCPERFGWRTQDLGCNKLARKDGTVLQLPCKSFTETNQVIHFSVHCFLTWMPCRFGPCASMRTITSLFFHHNLILHDEILGSSTLPKNHHDYTFYIAHCNDFRIPMKHVHITTSNLGNPINSEVMNSNHQIRFENNNPCDVLCQSAHFKL